jgi:prepilin-type N-terminal cleavage/methylation domain-containing protein
MKQTFKRNLQKGFTLVELLIVVIILAILAAIVVPQFSSSTDDAKLSALDTNLGTMRSTIEIFRAQHGIYPGAAAPSGTSIATGCTTAGTNTATAAGFIDQMKYATDVNGFSCQVVAAGSEANFRFGPYMRNGIPDEPTTNKGSAAADIAITTAGTKLAGASTATGWKYDSKSGEFIAASSSTVAGKVVSSR